MVNLAERADDKSGRGNAAFPQPLNDRGSVDSWQHSIDRHYDIFRCESADEPIIAVGREMDLIALRHKRLYNLLACFPIVFNDKNRHRLPAMTWYSDGSDSTRLPQFYHKALAQRLTYSSEIDA
jgi:hypothetical protein